MMFDTWISDVQQALTKSFPDDRHYNAEDLTSTKMPSSVGHFLTSALERRAARIEFSVESDWFDAGTEEVRIAADAYRNALTATARYPRSVWKSSLERATTFVASYLINPSFGLTNFVFGESDEPVPVTRIKDRLGYFGSNPELRAAVEAGLHAARSTELGPSDLRTIVLKADRMQVKDYEPSDWVKSLAPLLELARLISPEGEEPKLPVDVLKAFFDAKNYVDAVRRLDAVQSVRGEHELGSTAIRMAAGEQPEPVVEEEAEVEQVVRVARNDHHRTEKATAVPRWMQFAGGAQSQPTVASADPVQTRPLVQVDDPAIDDDIDEGPGKIGQRAPVPDDLGTQSRGDGIVVETTDIGGQGFLDERVPLWTKFRGESAPDPVDSVPSVPKEPEEVEESASLDSGVSTEEAVLKDLNPVQQAWFTNHLFGGDRERWRVVMALLGQASDWNQASEIIAIEVFERQGIDIYSRPAVDFTNAVEANFR